MTETSLEPILRRIAEALERLAPPPLRAVDLAAAEAFVWQPEQECLEPVAAVNRVDLALLKGIDQVRGHPVRQHPPLRRRAARQQRAAVGR